LSSTPSRPAPRTDIAAIRREQIVDAATAVIVEQGLPSLSLSKIEDKANMSRGQLTYYFPTREDILLAVFDRMIERMHERSVEKGMPPPPCITGREDMWTHLRMFLGVLIGRPPLSPEFHALHYSFLSQIGHRDDFRGRLVSLYEGWRKHLAGDMAKAGVSRPRGAEGASDRVMASFVQAIIHGVILQLDADPEAFDRGEMLELVLAVLAPWFQVEGDARG